jgi:hypothetical protein
VEFLHSDDQVSVQSLSYHSIFALATDGPSHSPVLINRIGWRTYLIFMVLLALFIPVIYFFYPETSNLSLEDIDLIFLPVEMGGLGGNARIRMTPEMAAERVAARGMSKGDVAEQVEKAKMSEERISG